MQLAGALSQTVERVERAVPRGQALQEPLPAIAAIDELLRHRERRRGAVGLNVLERTGQTRCVAERRVLGEEPGDLELGVLAVREPAKVLDNDGAVEHHGGVALLAAQTSGSSKASAPVSSPAKGIT